MGLDTDTREQLITGIRRFVDEKLIPREAEVAEADAIPADVLEGMREMGLARAKMFATEIVGRVTDRNVQVHGGHGYVREYRAEQLFRDAQLYRIYEGTTQIQ